MIEHISPQLLVIFTLLVGSVNLVIPLIIRKNMALRNGFLLSTSLFFLGNVLLLDYIFLDGVESYFVVLDLARYSLALHMEALGLIFLTLLATLWFCALLYTIKFLA